MGTQVVANAKGLEGTNGELSPARQHAVEQGLALYHQVAEERDALVKEVAKLRTDISGYKVAIDAKDAIMADLESRIVTMQMVRDEAVARRAQCETVLSSMLALGRAHNIRNDHPLIQVSEDDNELAAE